MRASTGDRIVIRGRNVGSPDRHGEVVEVKGESGAPPYLVKFDNGHETIVFPGPDVVIEHVEPV